MEFTKKHLFKDEPVLDLTAAASQILVNYFVCNIVILLCLEITFFYHVVKTLTCKTLTYRCALGIDTVSYAMTLANHNSGRFLTSLKEPAP